MDLKNLLVTAMPKTTCNAVAHYVLDQPESYVSLLDLVEYGSAVQSMKASWVIAHIRLLNAKLSEQHQHRILNLLRKTAIGGVRRELLRSLEGIELNELIMEELLEIAINWITDMDQDVAVRYLSQRIMLTRSNHIVELRPELELIKQLQLAKTGRFP